ncbi:MAG: NAD(+) synthase [Eubacterium sp.]|nr:NAD(+) synthase [Eubacterium sp.]
MEYFYKDFDPEKAKDLAVGWVREFFETSGPGCNAVVAISGGKDSSVAAALCVEALGKDRVFGVLMPNGVQKDIDMSHRVVDFLGIDHVTINIKDTVDSVLKGMTDCGIEPSLQTKTNLPARVRMAVTYAVSQSKNGRVCNTCNLSEDWVGYSTRYGDTAGDFSPLSFFTVQEVRAIGTALGLPDDIVYKVPIDGLTPYTDEENLGFTYNTLDKYIRTGEIDDPEIKEKIDKRHAANVFKLKVMPAFKFEAPIVAVSPHFGNRSIR